MFASWGQAHDILGSHPDSSRPRAEVADLADDLSRLDTELDSANRNRRAVSWPHGRAGRDGDYCSADLPKRTVETDAGRTACRSVTDRFWSHAAVESRSPLPRPPIACSMLAATSSYSRS